MENIKILSNGNLLRGFRSMLRDIVILLFAVFLILFIVLPSHSTAQDLWGMTYYGNGGDNDGVICEFNVSTQTYTNHMSFDATSGIYPWGSLLLATDGNVYGMTRAGGNNNDGVIFQYSTVTNTFTKLIDFTGTSGSYPGDFTLGSLMQASDGNLYGMSYQGGTNGEGVIFQYNISTSTFTKLLDFTGTGGTYPGTYPCGNLFQASDGNLYGMTYQGGINNEGVIFEYNIITSTYGKLLDFTGTGGTYPGSYPMGSLMQASDGSLYAMTSEGGANSDGVIFKYSPTTRIYTKMIDFTGSSGSYEGTYPFGSLLQASDGNLYGLTFHGGANDAGVLFQCTLGGNYTDKIDFAAGSNGEFPRGSLMQASDGNIYGMAYYDGTWGTNNYGILFQYTLGGIYTVEKSFNLGDGIFPTCTLVDLCVPIITGNPASCINSTGNIYRTLSGMSNYKWTVSSGGTITSGGTSTSDSVIVTWNNPGQQTVSVEYTNPITGCNPATTNYNVNVRPQTITGIASASPTTLCSGSNLTLSLSSYTGTTVQWQTSTDKIIWSNINGANTIPYTATAIMPYYRAIVISGTCSVGTSNTVTVTVNPSPTATIVPSGSTTFCKGGSVNLNANTGAGLSYQWMNGSGIMPGQITNTFTATTADNYSVVISQTGCSTTSGTITVTVPLPNITITPTQAGICSGESVSLTANIITGCTVSDLPPNLQLGLVGYYPFCGNANDVSGNGINGTVYGANLTTDRFGNPNNAYAFNGVNNYIQAPADKLPTHDRTISLWSNTNTLANYTLLGYGGRSCGESFMLMQNGSSQLVIQGHCNVNELNTSSISGIPGNWEHVAVTIKGNIQKIFFNGVLIQQNNAFYTPTYVNSADLFFGVDVSPVDGLGPYTDPNTGFFNGSLDDIQIYNRAIADSEVVQLYKFQSTPPGFLWSTGDTTQSINVSPIKTTTYKVIETNIYGCSNTDSVTVKVGGIINPNNIYVTQARAKGNDTILSVSPIGKTPFSYQWLLNNTNLPGATTSNFKLTPIMCTDSGIYSCVITNSCDTITAKIVKLYVTNCSRFRHALTGYVKYDNADSTVMTNTNVVIANSGDTIIGNTTTDVTGYYVFVNLINGKYKLTCNTNKAWGGVNPVDALIVNRVYIGMYILTDPLKILAADVNDDKKINPTDALIINRRYIGLYNSFKIKDWLFSNPTISVNGMDISKNIIAICAGDVNASYIPPARIMNYELGIRNEEVVKIDLNKPFDIPVYLNDNIELGAIGLKFKVQSLKFKVLEVISNIEGLIFNITNDGVNIAWSAEKEGYSITPDKPLFMLRVVSSELSNSINNKILITSESVLADIDANIINTDKLTIPSLIDNSPQSTVSLMCYPNPFNNYTNINYTIPEDANVEINLFNVLGEKIATIVLTDFEHAGNHSLQYFGSNLNEGVYYCRLNVYNGNSTYSKTNIIMIVR